MSDDKQMRDGRDHAKVDAEEQYEVAYFAGKHGISAARARQILALRGIASRAHFPRHAGMSALNEREFGRVIDEQSTGRNVHGQLQRQRREPVTHVEVDGGESVQHVGRRQRHAELVERATVDRHPRSDRQ